MKFSQQLSAPLSTCAIVLTLSTVGCKPNVECSGIGSWPNDAAPLSFIVPKPNQALCIGNFSKKAGTAVTKYEAYWDIEGTIQTVLAGTIASLADWTLSYGKGPTVETRLGDSQSAILPMRKGNQEVTLILTQAKPPFLTRAYTHVSLMMSVRN